MRVGRRRSQLRKGDIVELRSPAEILATLDHNGCLEGVPFMPEMLQYVGRRYTVTARVERACDTINPVGVKRMPDTVLLDDLRCDGSAHGGCDAGCRLYWKEAWLERVPSDGTLTPAPSNGSLLELEERIRANTTATRNGNGSAREVYRCQATEFPRATQPLRWYDARSFTRELTCGNVGVWRWLRVTIRAAFYAFATKLGLRLTGPVHPRPQVVDDGVKLDLEAGDRVRVRPQAEIEQTLDPSGKTRGLWFDREMLPHCGNTYTVERPVRRFIDEASGEMIELKSDAVILGGVICTGHDSVGRWFCPRAIYPWWRECWLSRVEPD